MIPALIHTHTLSSLTTAAVTDGLRSLPVRSTISLPLPTPFPMPLSIPLPSGYVEESYPIPPYPSLSLPPCVVRRDRRRPRGRCGIVTTWPGVTAAVIAAIPTSDHLDILFPTANPPLLNLAGRIIVVLYPALRVASPLFRVPAWDRHSIGLCRNRIPHRVVVGALLKAIGEVEDCLVQPRGHHDLHRHHTWQAFFFTGISKWIFVVKEGRVVTHQRSW